MHCHQCGADVIPQAVYCHKCGARLAGEDAPSSQESEAERFRRQAAAAQEPGTQEETQLWEGRYSPRAMLGAWALTATATIGLLAAGISIDYLHTRASWLVLLAIIAMLWLYQAAALAYRRLSIHYLLTNQRLIHESGILRRITDRVELIDVDDVTLEQGPLERLVAVGTVRVTSSDRTHPELPLRGIDNARQVCDLLDNLRRAERRRRGLHIEQV